MIELLKAESEKTYTENGAAAYRTTGSECLDLFSAVGAMRSQPECDIVTRFVRAYAQDADKAMRILFFARDVREGLGERRVFRVLMRHLAETRPESVEKNISCFAEFGRFDDLLCLFGTPCEKAAMELIKAQLKADEDVYENTDREISLLVKWLPSVNASNADTVRNAKKIARFLGMTDEQYRKTLSRLRGRLDLVENRMREKDYCFDYEKVPSRAMKKYIKAFYRNDAEGFGDYLELVNKGVLNVHTGTLTPYELVEKCFMTLLPSERRAVDTLWRNLPDFAGDENALVVVDGSGSMYGGKPQPAAVAMSLGIYFAERNTGRFAGHFITFSQTPRLVEVKGGDIAEKVSYCMSYNEAANTNVDAVFRLILDTAVKNHLPQSEMPSTLFFVSDMEFDCCADNAELTNFEQAKRAFASAGYSLPRVVFWNVASRHGNQPVRMDEKGVTLVSGCTPRLFSMVTGGTTPEQVMEAIIGSERYAKISA